MGLLSMFGLESKARGTQYRLENAPGELLAGQCDWLERGYPDHFLRQVKKDAEDIRVAGSADMSASEHGKFDDRTASPFVGGYFGNMGYAVSKGALPQYIDGLQSVGLAVHNMPQAAQRFAKGLVIVHQEVQAHAGDEVAARVRGVREAIFAENLHDDSPIKAALRAHGFDGRAAGPAQVAGTAAAVAPN